MTTNELVNQVTIVGKEIEQIGPITVARVSVTAGEDTIITGVGFSRRDPLDKPNRRIGNQLAVASALINAGQRLARDANRLVKEADRQRERAEAQAAQDKTATEVKVDPVAIGQGRVRKAPARKASPRKKAAARAN